MPYVDTQSIHNPATGTVAPATWGDQVRDNLEFLIDPPACAVNHSTTQNVVTGTTWTVLAADSEDFDNDSMHSTVTNNSRITIQTAGRYLFSAVIDFGINATGFRGIRFLVNGTAVKSLNQVLATSTVGTILSANRRIVLAAGEYVELQAAQGSGVTLAVSLYEFSAGFMTR